MPYILTSVLTVSNRCDVFEEVTGTCRESMERDEFVRSCSRMEVSTKFGDIDICTKIKIWIMNSNIHLPIG